MSAPPSDGERNDTQAAGGSEGAGTTPAAQAGVLGNLPKTRPSVRSPRRVEKPEPAADDEDPTSRAEPDARSRDREDESGSPVGGSEIEALARGGIAIAGEAASLGLRIAGRAAAAVRDAVERR